MSAKMTENEFVAEVFHEFRGAILDIITNDRKGGDLSLWLRANDARLTQKLKDCYTNITKPEGKK